MVNVNVAGSGPSRAVVGAVPRSGGRGAGAVGHDIGAITHENIFTSQAVSKSTSKTDTGESYRVLHVPETVFQ